jgi:hypothetical protein
MAPRLDNDRHSVSESAYVVLTEDSITTEKIARKTDEIRYDFIVRTKPTRLIN